MNNSPHDEDDDIGRRLYAAVVSTKLVCTMDYALEFYVPEQVHEGWEELGRILQSSIPENTLDALLSMKKQPANWCRPTQSAMPRARSPLLHGYSFQ